MNNIIEDWKYLNLNGIKGWHGRIYSPDDEFYEWVEQNTISCELTFRFNSGHPYYHIYIENEEEATFFKLTWMAK